MQLLLSDFWPSGHGFDSRSGRYQASRSTQPSIPSRVGKSSTALHRLGLRRGVLAYVGLQVKLWHHTSATPHSSDFWDDLPMKNLSNFNFFKTFSVENLAYLDRNIPATLLTFVSFLAHRCSLFDKANRKFSLSSFPQVQSSWVGFNSSMVISHCYCRCANSFLNYQNKLIPHQK